MRSIISADAEINAFTGYFYVVFDSLNHRSLRIVGVVPPLNAS
jgi:hypothetical protein